MVYGMVKTQLTLYVDNVLKDQAKAQGLNISSFVTSALEIELQIRRAKDGKDAIIEDLKMINTKLAESNRTLKKELDNIKIQLEKAKKKSEPKVLKTFSVQDGVAYEG